MMTNNERKKLREKEREANAGRGKSLRGVRLLRLVGWFGLLLAIPFFLWVPLGLLGLTPTMVDVFGIVGLRFPAAVTIAGLLLAAVGFHEI